MDEPTFAWPLACFARPRACRGTASALALAALTLGACHTNSAGGRPTDGGRDVRPDLSEKLAPPDAYCAPDAMGGGGVCPINFCGQVRSVAVLGAGETASTGADAICTPGYSCVPAEAVAGGTALQLRCVAPQAGALAFGAACDKDPTKGMRCANDALCVPPPTGAAAGASFCAALCRADADCPANAYCLEYKSATLPNGSFANLGMCTPKDKLGATPCAREAECAAGQGCVFFGARSNLLVCRPGGAKSLGAACGSSAECRSGECYDRDGHLNGGGAVRTQCAGVCQKNSDCGADQRCVRLAVFNNGTPSEPRDDVVSGYCRTLFVPLAAGGCVADAGCPAGRTCDTVHGNCYRAGAPNGAACAVTSDCDLGAGCVTGARFPGGYCQSSGCVPGAAAGVDACGADSVCAQRAADDPVHVCYETCAQAGDCSRFTDGYICTSPKDGQPANICIGS